jgi:H+/Cl- antiporter ClcA
VTLVAILIGFFVGIVGGVAAVLVMYTFHNLDLAHELYWALEVPLPVMLVLGGVVGTAGAGIAVYLTRLRHRPVTHP